MFSCITREQYFFYITPNFFLTEQYWDSNHETTSYTYDAVGNLIKTELPNNTTEIRGYDQLNHLISVENRNTDELISSYNYTFDKVGNRTGVEENNGRQVEYTYDNLYHLVQEAITDSFFGNSIISYTYDAVGNRLSRNDSGAGQTIYTYDNNDRLLSEVLNGQITTYTYDNNGNTLSKFKSASDQTVYRWDDQNHLIGADVITATATQHTNYRYNSDGIRVAEVVDGQETRYLIDANRPDAEVLEEYTPSGTLQVSYVYGRDLISQNRSGIQSFYEKDGLHNTRALSNASGNVTDTYTYDAFGNQIATTGNTVNNYRYRGEQYDTNLNNYYQRARYYDSGNGRFTRRDIFEGNIYAPVSLHKYLYANGNPVNFLDPSGYYSIEEVEAASAIADELAASPGFSVNFVSTNQALLASDVITGSAPAELVEGLGGFTGKADKVLQTFRGIQERIKGVREISEVAAKVWLQGQELVPILDGQGMKAVLQKLVGEGVQGIKDVDFIAEDALTKNLTLNEAKKSITQDVLKSIFGGTEESIASGTDKFTSTINALRRIYTSAGATLPEIDNLVITGQEIARNSLGEWSIEPATGALLRKGVEVVIEGLPVIVKVIPF